MKVLHLISGGDTGGAKTHIISLIKSINKLIDTKIICFIEDTFFYEAKAAGIDIEVFEQKSRYDMSVVGNLVNEIDKMNYDVIHCHGARANFIAMFLQNRVRQPFITTIHSDYELDFKDNLYKKLVFTTLNKIALKRFKYYIAISDTFKEMLIERKFNEEEIFTVYNGIDMKQELEYSTKEDFLEKHGIDYKDKIIVGIIARLDKVKNHTTLIKAASILKEKNENIVFLIAGDGNKEKILVDLVKELNLEEVVYFIGFIEDKYSFFNAIDINILTSLSESFPYAVLEGALMKKPIISTNVGGLGKLIENGENGYLIPVGDYVALADKINILGKDKEKLKIMGEKLHKKVGESFSSQVMAKEHVKIYEEIIRKGK